MLVYKVGPVSVQDEVCIFAESGSTSVEYLGCLDDGSAKKYFMVIALMISFGAVLLLLFT